MHIIQFASRSDADEHARIMARARHIEVDTRGREKCVECHEFHWQTDPHGKTTYTDKPK